MIPGPYVNVGAPCRWCGQHVRVDDAGSYVSDSTGRSRCTPEERGERCRLGQEASYGLDPLRLLSHDDRCICQKSLGHYPAHGAPYPYPDRVPWHCGDPMQLLTIGWRCRGRVADPRPRRRAPQTYTACGVILPLGAA